MPLASSQDEPMVLEDGTVVSPIYGTSSNNHKKFTAVPTNREAQRQVTSIRRRLSDMPLPPKQLNLVSVICAYTIMGLSDDDIALALQLPVERIQNIKILDAYMTVYNSVTQSILDEDADDVRSAIASNAKKAVQTVSDLLDDDFSSVRLAAAKDILDRAGHRPVDVVDHRHSLEGDLRIVVTREDDISRDGIVIDDQSL